jgi:hypothetical protein
MTPKIEPTAEDIAHLTPHGRATAKFSLSGSSYVGKCVHVYDGDTVHVVLRIPAHEASYKWIIRLNGIDTPEIKSKVAAEKRAAIAARDYLRAQILDKIVVVECGEFDKYGRLLGVIYHDGICMNTKLVELEYAHVYDGGAKAEWGELGGADEVD